MRDLRDPEKLGKQYLRFREAGMWIEHAVYAPAEPYTDGGHISSDPANHHSKTPQTMGELDTGGTP